MNKMFMIARWEYLDKVRRRTFWIGVLLMPAIMGGAIALSTSFAMKEDKDTKAIGIVDLSDSVAAPLSAKLASYTISNGRPNYSLERLPIDAALPLDSIRARGDRMVLGHLVEAWLLIPRDVDTSRVIDFRGENTGNIKLQERLEKSVQGVLVERSLRRAGLLDRLGSGWNRPIDLKGYKVSKEGAVEKGFESTFFIAYAFVILMMVMIMISGQLLVRGLVEEKSNRIIEILFSSVSPTQLLAGKVIGLSGVGLTQVALWIVGGLAIANKFNVEIDALKYAPLMFVYFALGYTLFASIFVGVGSLATTEQEAQQMTSYLSLPLTIPIMLIMAIVSNPNDQTLRILSMIPIFAPSFFVMRIAVQMPETWEIVLSLALLVASILLIVTLSGRMFRIAMLMYGKRPSIPQIWRLMRAG